MANDLTPLLDLIRQLVGENGCPWDQEQTHQSLRTDLLEEAYEVVSAIDANDMENLKEELGDLLFHIAFQVVLAEQENNFSFSDVVEDVVAKMVRRHPHVFGDQKISTKKDVLLMWDDVKKTEKSNKKLQKRLCGIPTGMKDLIRLEKVISKTTKNLKPTPQDDLIEEIQCYLAKTDKDYGKVLLLMGILAKNDGVYLDQALGQTLAAYEASYQEYITQNEENIDFLTLLREIY